MKLLLKELFFASTVCATSSLTLLRY